MMPTDLFLGAAGLAFATFVGWVIYRVSTWQARRWERHCSMAMAQANHPAVLRRRCPECGSMYRGPRIEHLHQEA